MPIRARFTPALATLATSACFFNPGSPYANGTTGDIDTTNVATTAPTSTSGVAPNCGDLVLDPGEECDDGQAGNGACTPDCKDNVCGDGWLGPGELCDDDTATCIDCQRVVCSDGVVAGDEQCDDGNGSNSDACTNACKNATCGDGFLHEGTEQCDDGNPSDADGCIDCHEAVCGDGVVWQDVEGCDDGNQVNDDACSNNCALASCGDGIVGPGEACDDGNDSDADACLNTCKDAFCGDGFVLVGVEACDDGNQLDNDACLANCVIASCGDGHVHDGVEACDDGNATDGDLCSNACAANPKRVFVSSKMYTGALGGVTGADTKCKSMAQAAGLGGNWKAWISGADDSSAPAARFTRSIGGYFLPNGTQVANNWDDLVDGLLQAKIGQHEPGANVQGVGHTVVHTNTKADGTRTGDAHCAGWTSDSADLSTARGSMAHANVRWTEDDVHYCSIAARIYCFEQ
ncbi:DUF4215 domain-containing protein [Nannocystis bainbridge]|uniref:DUF4215 domain-containing protein n=1 Tax=Nannocystis bainbridge TaxID=2995303 RepID=A0ABT5E665_9BACT|nr:DUF4215 domain-containing protein [Nannocystis bainbridge]MDC0720834.1 DUF4215 domain-containing protein [Nannocystis bainbridge]